METSKQSEIEELERLAATASSQRRGSIVRQIEQLRNGDEEKNPMLGAGTAIIEDEGGGEEEATKDGETKEIQCPDIDELQRLKASASTSARRHSIETQIERVKRHVDQVDAPGLLQSLQALAEEDSGVHKERKSMEIQELERLAASATDKGRRKSVDDKIDAQRLLELSKEESANNPLLGVNDTISEGIGDTVGPGMDVAKEKNLEIQELKRLAATATNPTRRKSIDDKIKVLQEVEKSKQAVAEDPLRQLTDLQEGEDEDEAARSLRVGKTNSVSPDPGSKTVQKSPTTAESKAAMFESGKPPARRSSMTAAGQQVSNADNNAVPEVSPSGVNPNVPELAPADYAKDALSKPPGEGGNVVVKNRRSCVIS